MNDEQEFKAQCLEEISQQGENAALINLTRQWVDESAKSKYSYFLIHC